MRWCSRPSAHRPSQTASREPPSATYLNFAVEFRSLSRVKERDMQHRDDQNGFHMKELARYLAESICQPSSTTFKEISVPT